MIEQTSKKHPYLLLSIIAPLSIFLVTFFLIYPEQAPEGWVEQEEYPPQVQKIMTRLNETEPEIVLVGSSIVPKAVDEKFLAKELGLSEDGAQILWASRATAPVVTLMIQKRILEMKKKPKVLIVLSTPRWMLSNNILIQKEFDMHSTGNLSPELEEILDLESSWKRRYSQKRSEVQDNTQGYVRYWFGEKLFNLSEEEVSQQLEVVFDNENKRTDQVKEQKLIQHNVRDEKAEEKDDFETKAFPPEDERLIYKVIEEAREAGINVVLVEMPTAKMMKRHHTVSKEETEKVAAKYEELGAGYLSYFNWQMDNIFVDTLHMNERGQALFTKMLVADLKKMNIFDEKMKSVKLPKEAAVPKLRWSGKEGVLLQNQTLDIVFTEPWTNGQIEFCASGEIEPTSSMLRFQGKEVKTERTWGSELWCERFEFDELKKGLSVQVENNQEMEMILHQIRVNETDLLKQKARLAVKPEISVLKDGEHAAKQIFEKAETPPWMEPYAEGKPNFKVGRLSFYREVNDLDVVKKYIPWECTPLEALYKGKSQSSTKQSCKIVFNETGKGDNCFVSQWWVSVGIENIEWSEVFVGLKKDRACQVKEKGDKTHWWVYPRDSIQWSFDAVTENYSSLRMFGTTIGEGQWRIQIRNEEKIFLDKTIEEIDPTGKILFDIPIREKKDTNIVLEITALEGENNYMFIRSMELDN